MPDNLKPPTFDELKALVVEEVDDGHMLYTATTHVLNTFRSTDLLAVLQERPEIMLQPISLEDFVDTDQLLRAAVWMAVHSALREALEKDNPEDDDG